MTADVIQAEVDREVAILARRGGRAQTSAISPGFSSALGCDPRPARWPGAVGLKEQVDGLDDKLLRSSPGAVAGRSVA